jgi:hypothetical protein
MVLRVVDINLDIDLGSILLLEIKGCQKARITFWILRFVVKS